MKFRKKPVVIEAVQISDDIAAVKRFCPDAQATEFSHGMCYDIPTLEGWALRASPGDWIIKGVAGEFYPCKPDIFEQTYEAAD